jgi:hypothetical protein
MHKTLFCNNIEFVGVGRARWFVEDKAEDSANRNIAAILIDTKFLVNNWVKKNEDNIDALIRLIESNIGGASHE